MWHKSMKVTEMAAWIVREAAILAEETKDGSHDLADCLFEVMAKYKEEMLHEGFSLEVVAEVEARVKQLSR